MIAFGMEDELANTVGIDKVSQIEEALARDIVQFEDRGKAGETPAAKRRVRVYIERAGKRYIPPL